jgi:COP9 signalosome complex subunit 3
MSHKDPHWDTLRAWSQTLDGNEALTETHVQFLKTALQLGQYAEALPVSLSVPNLSIEQTKLPISEILLSRYYAGRVLCATKRFKEALIVLGAAVSAPVQACSAIQVEAFKRYVLVYLLVFSAPPAFPRGTCPVVERAVKHYAKIYLEFAQVFGKLDVPALQTSLNDSMAQFMTDRTLGLAKQVLVHSQRTKILLFGKVYRSLSLSEMSRLLQLDVNTVERHLLDLIKSKTLNAEISERNGGMVFFKPKTVTEEDLKRLKTNVQSVLVLSEKIKLERQAVDLSGQKKTVASMDSEDWIM